MSKSLYIFLTFDLGQRRVRLKPLKRNRVGDDGFTFAGLQQTLPGGFKQQAQNDDFYQI